jgi:hypothetical protein
VLGQVLGMFAIWSQRDSGSPVPVGSVQLGLDAPVETVLVAVVAPLTEVPDVTELPLAACVLE